MNHFVACLAKTADRLFICPKADFALALKRNDLSSQMEIKKFSISNDDKKFLEKRILVIISLVALAFVILYSLDIEKIFNDALQSSSQLAGRSRLIGALVFVFFSAVSVLLSLFSSAPMVPLANISFGNLSTIVLLLTGWILGDAAAYFIGSSAGYPILSRFMSSQKLEQYKNRIPENVQFWFVLVFRLAIPAEITGYTLGVIRYPFAKYILASFISEIPFALLLVYSSQALIDKKLISFISLVSLAILLLSLTFIIFKNNLKKNNLVKRPE